MKICSTNEVIGYVVSALDEYRQILIEIVEDIITTAEPSPTKLKRLRNRASQLLSKKILNEVKK